MKFPNETTADKTNNKTGRNKLKDIGKRSDTQKILEQSQAIQTK